MHQRLRTRSIRHQVVTRFGLPGCLQTSAFLLLCLGAVAASSTVHAQRSQAPTAGALAAQASAQVPTCLPQGDGYLRARLAGSVRAELDWRNAGTECTGAVRPTDGGVRMRFTHAAEAGGKLVLVFGIANLREGKSARALPVNVTLIREGSGEFYSTQGDDKCTLDEVSQQPLVGIPHRTRSYRVIVRGFCTEPARAVRGEGAVLISRFDYAGRVDFDDEVSDDAAERSN